MRFRYWPAALSIVLLLSGEGDAVAASPAQQSAPGKHEDAQRASSLRMTGRAGCADRLRFEVDPANLRRPHVAPAVAEQARARIESAFRRTASELCVAGTLSVATFLAFDRVLLNHAEGAMEPTLYPGTPPRTLIYELFDVYRAPVDERLLREGLLCLANPQREGCYQD